MRNKDFKSLENPGLQALVCILCVRLAVPTTVLITSQEEEDTSSFSTEATGGEAHKSCTHALVTQEGLQSPDETARVQEWLSHILPTPAQAPAAIVFTAEQCR